MHDLTLRSVPKIMCDVNAQCYRCVCLQCAYCHGQCVNPDKTHLAEGKQTRINIRELLKGLDWGGKEDQSAILWDLERQDVLW